MKDLSATVKKSVLVVGLIIAAILACQPANAGEGVTTFSISGKDFYSRGNLNSNNRENPPGATDLMIPLSGSFSLDLRLSSVDRGQSPSGEKEFGAPPIPLPKTPGSDFRYSRLGVGLSFGF